MGRIIADGPVRLALFAGSPIYYQVPLYRLLAADTRLDFTVIFASSVGIRPHDGGYRQPVIWDIDLLQGYRSEFVRKADANPGDGGFFALRDYDLVRILRRGRFEALWLHGYQTFSHLLASTTQRVLGGAVLYREEQTLLHRRTPWKAALKRATLPLLFRDAYGLYIGSENHRWFQHWGVPDERLFAVPYVVDNTEFQRAATELAPRKLELRREFGIGDEAGPVIVSVSRLIPKKQPLALIDAFARVRARRRCTLLLVGSGELERALRAKVEHESIPDVVFAGFINRSGIAGAYACADIFVLASLRDETWGVVVNEAMNFSLPVIATDVVGSATDLVRDGENGFIVPATGAVELTAAIERLVESEELRMRFGDASLARIADWTYAAAAEGITQAVAASVGPARWAAACAGASSRAPAATGAVSCA